MERPALVAHVQPALVVVAAAVTVVVKQHKLGERVVVVAASVAVEYFGRVHGALSQTISLAVVPKT